MKALDISPETANALRQLIRQSQEAYVAFDETQKQMKKRYLELLGPIGTNQIAGLRKDSNRIEVVPHLGIPQRSKQRALVLDRTTQNDADLLGLGRLVFGVRGLRRLT